MPRLLIAASGTGGHLFPALAVADSMSSDWAISWVGVPDRLENRLVPNKYKLFKVDVSRLQGPGIRNFFELFRLLFAIKKICRILKEDSIDVVFTTGGYISAPAILAAKWCGLPVLLHESNAFPGQVTRLLGRFCDLVALGLPIAKKRLSGCRIVVTGTPVRSAFFEKCDLPDWVPIGAGPLIVVMGGSQGAVALNHMVRNILPTFLEMGCRVVHLTGDNDSDFNKLNHRNLVEKKFSHEVPSLLQNADLAISRAGAGALSELAVCGTPSVLVPYPQAKDRHQDANALCAAEMGAAVIVHQHHPQQKALGEVLMHLLQSHLSEESNSTDILCDMKQAMRQLANQHSSKILVEIINSINCRN